MIEHGKKPREEQDGIGSKNVVSHISDMMFPKIWHQYTIQSQAVIAYEEDENTQVKGVPEA